MSYQITCIERYLLESIGLRELTFNQIEKSTGLNPQLISSLLETFLASGLILTDKKKYILNLKKYKDTILKKKDTLTEVSQIVESCITSEKTQFHLKKIHLNSEEEITFNALLKNMECFISNLKPKVQDIKDKRVFFWGGGNYENICNSAINA